MNKYLLLYVLSVLAFTGCATKVSVYSVKPVEVASVAGIKNISVLNFSNDYSNISGQIESSLSNYQVNNQNYFEIIDRKNLDKILKEQKIQNSGLTNGKKSIQMGQLDEVQAIISGSVSKPVYSTNRYSQIVKKCDKKDSKGKLYCYDAREYCVSVKAESSANIKITSAETGSILYSKNIAIPYSNYQCGTDRYSNPFSKNNILEKINRSIVYNFVKKILPKTVKRTVELIDEPDIEYNSYNKELLENSIDFISKNRNDKAKTLLYKLIDNTKEKSFVPFYNLGVIFETEGNLKKASELYNKADSLTIKSNDALDTAIQRIKMDIKDKNKLNSQMKNKG